MLADLNVAFGLPWMALRYFNAAGADPQGEIGEAHDPETHLIPLVLASARGGARFVFLAMTMIRQMGHASAITFTSATSQMHMSEV